MQRHGEVSLFLRTAHKAGIINVDILKAHRSWVGEKAYIRPFSGTRPFPALKALDNTVGVSGVQQHFISAVSSVKNMARAISNEAKGVQSKHVHYPYGQIAWLPARLKS